MKSRFISSGLASAIRSGKTEAAEIAAKEQAETTPTPQTPPLAAAAPPSSDLGGLVRKEQTRLQEDLFLKERAEFHKHRQALLPELRDVIGNQQASLQSLESQVDTLIRVHQDLDAAVLPEGGSVSLTELREAKRNLDAARMELLKIQRAQMTSAKPMHVSTATAESAGPSLATLGFKQATLLGLSLTWPLIAALLLAALFIGICLLSMFKG